MLSKLLFPSGWTFSSAILSLENCCKNDNKRISAECVKHSITMQEGVHAYLSDTQHINHCQYIFQVENLFSASNSNKTWCRLFCLDPKSRLKPSHLIIPVEDCKTSSYLHGSPKCSSTRNQNRNFFCHWFMWRCTPACLLIGSHLSDSGCWKHLYGKVKTHNIFHMRTLMEGVALIVWKRLPGVKLP